MSTCVLDTAEAIREVRPAFQCPELRLRVRIVVRNMRSTVRLGHLQVGEQVGHRLGPHTTAAVGMQCECARLDVLLGYRNVVTENIEDHVGCV